MKENLIIIITMWLPCKWACCLHKVLFAADFVGFRAPLLTTHFMTGQERDDSWNSIQCWSKINHAKGLLILCLRSFRKTFYCTLLSSYISSHERKFVGNKAFIFSCLKMDQNQTLPCSLSATSRAVSDPCSPVRSDCRRGYTFWAKRMKKLTQRSAYSGPENYSQSSQWQLYLNVEMHA